MSETRKKIIEQQLDAARQSLLELNMRNRLLNFRPSKARTIHVIDELPAEVYDRLLIHERFMEFLPKTEEKEEQEADESQADLFNNSIEPSAEEDLSIWKLPPADIQISQKHQDRFLQTPLEKAILQKRLFYAHQQSRSVLEEQGYTIFFLALGFLFWKESPESQEFRKAPLILVPVELERKKVASSFRLRWTGEDILTNISLQAKLSEQGVELPDFEMPDDKSGIDNYFKSVTDSISKEQEWNVLADIYLDFFSFTKFIMYKDLDPLAWPEGMSPADHPLMRAIFDPSEDGPSQSGFDESEIDQKLDFRNLYHVMDSDPSQIAVIEDIKDGRNLVVEGPPGTGKSQTIANLIAELLALGRTVLFVSEKMAALEVVKSRLDKVGLGDFCLELHSRKSKKKEVLKELEKSIARQAAKKEIRGAEYTQLEKLRAELNGYAKSLREPIGALELSPFGLYCMKETAFCHFSEAGTSMPQLKLTGVKGYDQKIWDEATSTITNLAEALRLVKPVTRHPWRGTNPGIILPSDEEEVKEDLEELDASLKELNTAIESATETCKINGPKTIADLPPATKAIVILAESQPTDREILLNAEWNKPSAKAEALINDIELYIDEVTKTLSNFSEIILEIDVPVLLEEFKNLSEKFFRFFYKKYRVQKKQIKSLYKESTRRKISTVISDLEQAKKCHNQRKKIQGEKAIGKQLFGSHWRDENSDPVKMRDFAEWIVSFRQHIINKALSYDTVELVNRGEQKAQIINSGKALKKAANAFAKKARELAKRIGLDYQVAFGASPQDVPLVEISERINTWRSNTHQLQRWAQFVNLREACFKTAAKPLVNLIESDAIEPQDIIQCFKGNYADNLLRVAFKERPDLTNFVGELHEKKIKRFMNIDRDIIGLNRRRLAAKLYESRPLITGGASPASEAGILLSQFSRKRGHMSIRKLMAIAGGLVQKIKPCFMMSPLSIAQFLDPRTTKFDVIVFDEASQVRPQDALGAILRGNQLAVVGDTRQLPPTNFFDHIIQTAYFEDEDIHASVADVESIIHLCKQGFPTKMMNWHYRSKHETLIAVSNQEFYDNQLLIYPSPIAEAEGLGLQFVYLPDTIYDRGRSGTNRMEARFTAKQAVEHYRKYPKKSLGVGTFNIRQQQAILEEVELQLRQNPDIENYFQSSRHEHFFVKNLETIQGDERDVIFLSVGFGFDRSGKLTRNFGPLNHEGGWRRLNVLTTRAREQCVVFSNFRADDLSLEGTSPPGLRALKVFLNYAENRTLESPNGPEADVDSPFEQSVYDFLRSHNIEVQKQVGCAGFRVDLAAVDQNEPGKYILGIECDGAKYHSSPVARDRDRLRQQILEGKGWRIHRIWSTDWYRSRRETQKRLLEAVEKAARTNPRETRKPKAGVEESTATEIIESVTQKKKKNTTNKQKLQDIVQDYERCIYLAIKVRGELHEKSSSQLSQAVISVVEVEGPVHRDEVIRRIRTLWGLKRTGDRIHKAISKGIQLAVNQKKIRSHHNFLLPVEERPVLPRKRTGDPPLKIEFICDDEIAEAIKLVLKYQFATSREDLSIQTSRVFGFNATKATVSKRIDKVIGTLLNKKIFKVLPNGMIDLNNEYTPQS